MGVFGASYTAATSGFHHAFGVFDIDETVLSNAEEWLGPDNEESNASSSSSSSSSSSTSRSRMLTGSQVKERAQSRFDRPALEASHRLFQYLYGSGYSVGAFGSAHLIPCRHDSSCSMGLCILACYLHDRGYRVSASGCVQLRLSCVLAPSSRILKPSRRKALARDAVGEERQTRSHLSAPYATSMAPTFLAMLKECAHPQPLHPIGTILALKYSWHYKVPDQMLRSVQVAQCAEIDWAKTHMP
eukprot:1145329-Pelagomonas_calceolata.AAC.3